MAGKSLKVLYLFDLSVFIPPEEYKDYLKTEEWEHDAIVVETLKRLGHQVELLGLFDDVTPLLKVIRENRPDLVFNQSEAFRNDRKYEPHLASLLELLDVPYTGSGPECLRLCKDKGLTKKILSYHRISVPKFVISRKSHPIRTLRKFDFPAFIKPLNLEASEGISQLSFADNEKDALERVAFIHGSLGSDAIIEEYIEGREFYASILGNEKLTLLPLRELFFENMPDDGPKFATFKAKWDDDYRYKWGIDADFAAPLPDGAEKRLEQMCKKIFQLLQLRGYGRIDLRMKPDGEIFFIEANPNPSLRAIDDYALSAEEAGIDYSALVQKLISLANP